MVAAAAQLRCSPLARHYTTAPETRHYSSNLPSISFASSSPPNLSINLYPNPSRAEKFKLSVVAGGGGGGAGDGAGRGGGSGRGGDSGGDGDSSGDSKSSWEGSGLAGLLLNGWRSRVLADPQFPFKVLMEELVGVSACVLGDMASRPNFGLNELDFVFSTLVVGSILNFVLMYLLAPTSSTTAATLPSIFASCPNSHMFEPGAYGLLDRFGTLVYKGALFAAVGFAAGLAGTALSNGLIKMRKKMDPNFETPNKAPPTLLNSLTWATHMGVSSNLRYQTLNGVEFLLAKGLPPFAFKTSVLVLRCLNNVLGGMSFVVLARLTGSQATQSSVGDDNAGVMVEVGSVAEKEKLLKDGSEDLPKNTQLESK